MAASLSFLRGAVTATACLLTAVHSGCTEDCTEVEPAYAGDATDEAWRVMLDGRADAITGDDDAAVFTAPSDEDDLGESPTFAWSSGLQVAMAPTSPLPGRHRQRRGVQRAFDDVAAMILPSARAHLPPVTGAVYLLEVDVPGKTCPVAGFTTELSFAFDDDDWRTVLADGGERTVRMVSAFLTENRITEGPFESAPLALTVPAAP